MQAAKQQAGQQQAKPALVQDMEEACEPRCQIEHTDEHAAAAQQTTTTSSSATEAVASSSSFASFPMPVHFPSPAAQPESLVHPMHPFPNTGLAPPQHDHHHNHHHDQHHHHHHEQPHHNHHHEQHHHHHHQHQLAHGHVEAALSTLYNKMEEARQRLAATPAAQCAPLVGVITECARAIEALHSLSNGL